MMECLQEEVDFINQEIMDNKEDSVWIIDLDTMVPIQPILQMILGTIDWVILVIDFCHCI